MWGLVEVLIDLNDCFEFGSEVLLKYYKFGDKFLSKKDKLCYVISVTSI